MYQFFSTSAPNDRLIAKESVSATNPSAQRRDTRPQQAVERAAKLRVLDHDGSRVLPQGSYELRFTGYPHRDWRRGLRRLGVDVASPICPRPYGQ